MTQQERDRREALNYYVLGLLCERDDRIREAIEAFEKSCRLDPAAAPVFKALIPFYVALDRSADALAATRKVLELDPDDYETWYLLARQLKALGQSKEAREALLKGLKVPAVKDHPEVVQPMHLLLGMLYESAEEYAKAAEEYVQAARILDHPEPLLELAPLSREQIALRAAELYEKVGRMYLQVRRYDQAEAAYRLAQKSYPDGAGRLNYNLALLCKEQGKLPQAVEFLNAYLRLQPQGLEAYELKMALLQKLGRGAEILPWLEQASKGDPFNMNLKLLLARTYGSARQPEAAERLYLDLADKSPSADVFRGLFQLYRDQPSLGLGKALALLNGTLEQAKGKGPVPGSVAARAAAMVAALRDDPALARDFVQAAYRMGDRDRSLKFHTLHLLAILADRGRQLDEAERFYRKALQEASLANEAAVYSGLLRTLSKARKFEDVVQVCRDGLRRARNTHPTLFYDGLARALARLDKADLALAEAERGLNVAPDPDRFTFKHLKVRILVMAGKFAQAEAECQALFKEFRQPGEILEIRYLLSNVYSSARNFAKAEEQLALVLRQDPSNAVANNDLGYIWADQGKNLPEAEVLIRKAIDLDRSQRTDRTPGQIDQENAAYVDSLAWVLFRRGQIEAARRELERAVKLPDGDDPTIWDHLGDVYFRLGLTANARTAWQQALRLYQRERTRPSEPRYLDLQRKFKLLDSARQP
jgi:tetratricopeptide (TPR) repeat protein